MKEKKLIFQEISDILRGRINQREFVPGTMLPSESQLCKTYSVSRASIRKALELLEKENLIYRQAGVGSFIREQELSPDVNRTRLNIGMTSVASDLYVDSVYSGAAKASLDCNARMVYSSTADFIENNGRDLDGFIILAGKDPIDLDRIEQIAASGKPVAFINRFCDHPHVSYFTVDYELEARRGVQLLYKLGCRDIALIDCADMFLYAGMARASGYRSAVDAGPHPRNELKTPANISAVDEIRKFLRDKKPDALFVSLIIMFEYVMLACKYENIIPGQDIQIFCFSQGLSRPHDFGDSVIYVNMPLAEMADDAVRHIAARRTNPYDEPVAKKLYNSSFVIGGNIV